MDRAFATAQRNVMAFRRTVDPLTNLKLTIDVSQFDRGLEYAGARAAELADNVINAFRRIRISAAAGVELNVTADTSGLVVATAQVEQFKQATAGADATLTVRANPIGFTQALGSINELDRRAAEVDRRWGSTIHINTATVGIPEAVAEVRRLAAEAAGVDGDDILVTVDVDAATGVATLQAFNVVHNNLDGNTINIPVDVDAGFAIAQLGAVGAAAVTTTTMTNLLGASFAFTSAGLGLVGLAVVAAMSLLGPFIGALGMTIGLAGGAAAGFGLLAGAVWVLQSGLYDGGAAMAALTAQAEVLKGELVLALGPASLVIAEIGMQAMTVASQYMPMLGEAATATALAAQGGLSPLFDFLESQVGMDYIGRIFEGAAPIVGTLVGAVADFGIGFIAVMAELVPYGQILAEAIAGVAASFTDWAMSAESAGQISVFVQSAITVFGSLWNMLTSVGGALLNFAMVAGGDVAVAIDVVSAILTGLIDGFTWLYDTVGGAGIAFGLLAMAITPLVAAGFLATGAITAFVVAAWPVAAVAAAIAVAATLVYNNWSTVGPIFEAVWSSIMTGAQVVIGWITGTLVPAFQAAWPMIQAGAAAFVQWLALTWIAIWTTIGPTVMAALTAVYDFIVTIGTQITTWWATYFGPEGQLPTTWSSLWTGLQTAAATGWALIQAAISTGLTVLMALWNAVWPGLSTVVQGAWTIITSVVQGGITIIQGIITAFAGVLSGDWSMVWDGLGMIVSGAWTVISGIVSGGVDMVLGVLEAGWGWLSTVTQAAWDALWYIIDAVWSSITSTVEGWVSSIASSLESWWSSISASVSSWWDSIWSAIESAWSSISSTVESWVSSVSTSLESWWSSISTSVTSWWDTIWTAIESAWSSIYTTVETWVTSAYDTLESWWSSISDSVTSWWDSIWSYIDSIWSSIYDTVDSWISSAYDTLESWWSSIYDSAVSWWDSVWTAIDDAWSSISDTVASWTDAIWTAIEDTWTGILEGVSSFASSLYDSLYDGFWTAVSVAGEALASLLDAIQSAIDGIGIDIGIDIGSYAATIRDLTSYAKGGLALPVTSYAAGGRTGGLGTQHPSSRMHEWNEGMGNEAYIAQRGPRNKQLGILNTAASWFDLTTVPMGRTKQHDHRTFATGGLARVSSFEYGGLGPTHWDWSPEVAQIVSQISGDTGGCGTPNTYTNHDYIGQGDGGANSVDWWHAYRGDPIGISCGDSVQAAGRKYPGFNYDIWQGQHSSLGYWGDHYDHVHQTYGGSGGGGGLFCKAIRAGFETAGDAAKGVAHTALGAITGNPVVKGVGEWGVDTAIDAIIDHIASLLPACSGSGGGGGDCGAAIPAAVEQLGANPEYLNSMQSLGQEESGMDMGAINTYDINAIMGNPSTGCWQMIPSTFNAYAEPDCMDINDPLCQAMSSINYQDAVHGGPVWHAGYSEGGLAGTVPIFTNGGVVPGAGSRLAVVHGGERVLTDQHNDTLEALLQNPATTGAARNAVGGNQHIDASQQNNVEVNVYVEGGVNDANADRIAREIAESTGSEVVRIMGAVNSGTGANKHTVSKGFS